MNNKWFYYLNGFIKINDNNNNNDNFLSFLSLSCVILFEFAQFCVHLIEEMIEVICDHHFGEYRKRNWPTRKKKHNEYEWKNDINSDSETKKVNSVEENGTDRLWQSASMHLTSKPVVGNSGMEISLLIYRSHLRSKFWSFLRIVLFFCHRLNVRFSTQMNSISLF